MRYSFIILLLFCLLSGRSQLKEVVNDLNMQKIKAEIKDKTDITICELPVDPQISHEEWAAYLNENLILDDASLDTIHAGRYTVIAQFIIDPNGKISHVEILQNPGYGLGERVKKAISKYEGCWKLAKSNGQTIQSYRRQPVIFIVEEADECEDPIPVELIL